MENRKIVVFSSFNYYSFYEASFSEEWIKYRMNIFMEYTRKSLESQTYQEFIAIFRYHPKSHAIITKVLSEYPKLPNNIIFSYIGIEKLTNDFINDEDKVFYVRIDSDDMYIPDYFERLMNYKHKEDTEVIISQHGYIHDHLNKRLATYFHESPPFLTYIYNGKEFKNGKRYTHGNGHVGAINLKHELIDGYNYIITIHGNNSSSIFENPKYKLKELYNDEYKKVINTFKIYE